MMVGIRSSNARVSCLSCAPAVAFGPFVFMYSAFEINRERVAREAGLAEATTTEATPVTDKALAMAMTFSLVYCLPPLENGTSVAEDPDWPAQTKQLRARSASKSLHVYIVSIP
ncbi:hypothetical protein [Mesorhizobium sp. M4A.F.Ca.ET.022.05.2.1]|uniref:hypothetical protein n=1 Tax=Mesorhizobium sp. M4A.F.Ca.ET.022.05.2.1 TaxID=2496653 RepID=UPI00167729CD|nr:hypothetical protein [Mesorhizobium sp. M4A.F.Ca.ET.022.05.2.1]